ncbi:ornithine carbamoyltransferase, catabolic [Microlunatus endophyticus]|uniref:Ornithine carbamoyltransferase n=1 Tax=Microlunatus endophyticus TaxID=1716077 RepID=A0A917W1D7_9ACTN|nr:ornithine carbamoyltransferase [Microlunatus endophyticus]GGL49532.1 ornithine carbamoyltransferase, catabolic [Microlunatus endophyticus]
MTQAIRSFLADDDLSPSEQAEVLELALALKADPYGAKPLAGPVSVAAIYDKPTLRTQSSFAAGIAELGGYPLQVDGNLAGIGVRESVPDVARILGRQVGMIVWRTFGQDKITELAAYAGVPVVNALTDDYHPCQLLADLLTVKEQKGTLAGLTVAFLGDAACNMGNSWALAGVTAGMQVRFGAPEGYLPDEAVLARAAEIGKITGGSTSCDHDPVKIVAGADVVVTDTWVSMGKEDEAAARTAVFQPYAVTSELVSHAKPDAIVMHCLPAYRGKEIDAEVLDGPQSVIWDEAENRRHAQKAIMAWLWQQSEVQRRTRQEASRR